MRMGFRHDTKAQAYPHPPFTPNGTMNTVHLLDYVAGNVRSLANAIERLGYTIQWIKDPKDIEFADVRVTACTFDRS